MKEQKLLKRKDMKVTLKKLMVVVHLVCWVGVVNAETIADEAVRKKQLLNKEWLFTKDTSKAAWQKIGLPHCWNIADVMDDAPGYYRGAGWYKRILPTVEKGKKQFIYFDGANQETTVWINGKKAGYHAGGYTRFSFDITAALKESGGNEILVKVDNSYNPAIPPLTADFTFFGGLYRNVYLVSTDAVHINMNNYASNGVYIKTPEVSKQKAVVEVQGSFVNETAETRKLQVETTVYDSTGKVVTRTLSKQTAQPHTTFDFHHKGLTISNPALWSPAHPALYTITTRLYNARTHEVLDEVHNTAGMRWFSFSADSGFYINGTACKLIGASRHQDYEGMGNGVPAAIQVKDVEMIKSMGGNFLRVAHYPQDPVILETCDRLGLLASVEIPVVNTISTTDSFTNNCLQMQTEMIRQNFNHPSVVIWAYMNEVFLRPPFKDSTINKRAYDSSVTALARKLEALTRKEDPTRYTMIANHGDFRRYDTTQLTTIPMIVGWNLYNGWYNSAMEDFSAFMDKHHRELPGKPVIISEYGADADPRIRSFKPERFDKSVEYTTLFHQYYLCEMVKRPFVAGAAVWNLADFNSETREETMPHMNNKGLLTYNRIAKDPYYYYKAALVNTPFVKIASSYWWQRSGIADTDTATVCTQPLEVATNLTETELFINGKSLGKVVAVKNMCSWKAAFVNGDNIIRAVGVKEGVVCEDTLVVQFRVQPRSLQSPSVPFTQLNLQMGSRRTYLDEQTGEVWLPDQPYKPGAWGYTGGTIFNVKNGRQAYGTDKAISGTDNDPIYQTQQTGIEKYRLDAPKGNYLLTLHFAELQGENAVALPYNLDTSVQQPTFQSRIFDVAVNGKPILENLDIAAQYGRATAVVQAFRVTVTGNEGIELLFKAKSGQPILNALQLKKLN